MFRVLTVAILALVMLAGCSPVYKTDYRFTTPPTEEGRVCAQSCLDKKTACVAQCRGSATECRRTQALEGENAYLRYVNEQQRQNKPVEKRKTHFINYRQCDRQKSHCTEECRENHRICHSNCGGNVVEERYCTAFCDKE